LERCNLDCYGKCERDVYIDNKCIVHCKKNNYQYDRNSGLLSAFYNEFLNYTIEQIFEHTDLLNDELTEEEIRAYFESNKFDNEEYNKVLKNTIFIPSCIHFPTRDGRDTFDYLKILNLFGQIHFNYCEFYLSSLDLNDVECFFQDCRFHDRWTLYNYDLLENEDNVIYQTCEFKKTVSNYTPEKLTELAVYKYSQFDYTCTFNGHLNFDRSIFKNRLFNTEQFNYLDYQHIEILKFNKCIFEKEFKLNNYTIQKFILDNSIFKDKLEFKNNNITDVTIENTLFEQISIFSNSKFTNLYISESTFNDNIDFKDSIFGIKDKLTNKPTTLKSVIINKLINFRNVKFYYGLDIPDTKIDDLSNFLDADLAVKYTPIDTYRRLKHEFDSISNIIEANKFYQKEMEKREEDLKKELPKDFFEWVIFKIHGFTSEHSQNALLALFWIFIISYIYSYLFNFLGQEDYYKCILEDKFSNSVMLQYIYTTDLFHLFILLFLMILPYISANSILNKNYYLLIGIIATFFYINLTKDFTLSIVSNNINPFSIITEKGVLSFHELLYRVTIAYLLYQLIVSIRQNTRRK